MIDSRRAPLTLALLVGAGVLSLVGVVVTVSGGLDARTVAVSWLTWLVAVVLAAWPLSWGLLPKAPASRVVILVGAGLGFLAVGAYCLVASGRAGAGAPGWGVLATSVVLGVSSIVGGVVGGRLEGRAG